MYHQGKLFGNQIFYLCITLW